MRSSLGVGFLALALFGLRTARAQSPEPSVPPTAPPPVVQPPLPEPRPALPVQVEAPLCKGASAILVDAETGAILWEKNARVKRPIASTTKIITATLLIENGHLDDIVTFSEKARFTPYANLNAQPGERFKMRELLYAILMRSSNDGCVAAAEHVAGSAAAFAQRMNAKAKELGATDSHFVTVNGLWDPAHVSTARDLAIMARYAIQYPLFNEIVATEHHTLNRSINYKDVLVKNHNKFLAQYDGADGIKTGYIHQSGKCLVASSTRPDEGHPWRLISVVLNSPDIYGDSARLQDWGRKFYRPAVVAHKGEQVGTARVNDGVINKVPLLAAKDLTVIVPRDAGITPERVPQAARSLHAPVGDGQVAGSVSATVGGQVMNGVDLVAARPVPRIWTAGVAPWTGWSMFLAVCMLVPRYGRALAKSSRRRRRRLATGRCELDFERESIG